MNTKMSRRQKDIKSKLMAAIAMLLVSSIMMVSTTYAWFTLSTAPEVTGISTSVGANGNLEMALMPADQTTRAKDDFGIVSTTQDSMDIADKAKSAANVTWGNLVDLASDGTTDYGLDQINLYPSQLNLNDAGTHISTEFFLKTPEYGADGRVKTLLANTTTGVYENGSFAPDPDKWGVRAIGIASGLTERQMSFRTARAQVNSNRITARDDIANSLSLRGGTLGNIAIKYANEKANATFDSKDVAALKAAVGDLKKVLDIIDSTYKNALLAYSASTKNGTSDAAWRTIQSVIASNDSVLGVMENLDTALTQANITLSGDITAIIATLGTQVAKYGATRDKVDEASGILATFTGDDIPWNPDGETKGMYDVLVLLANTEQMEINGYKPNEVMNHLGELVGAVTSGEGIKVTILPNGGAYADIADHVGNYNATIVIRGIEYQGNDMGDLTATMLTASNEAGGNGYLNTHYAELSVTGMEPSGTGDEVMPISDFYGYIIDLAFRTNAPESNLLLQVDPADRIYDENNNADTMGKGSSMTFKAISSDFSEVSIKNLMKSIKVVFFDPENDNKIIADAKLDVDKATTGAEGITAKLQVATRTGTPYFGLTATTAGPDGTTATSTLYFYGDSKTEEASGVTTTVNTYKNKAGTTLLVETIITDAEGTKQPTYEDAQGAAVPTENVAGLKAQSKMDPWGTEIMPLTQNTATALSVLVYLDGTTVANKDVAYNAETSLTGKMNLQFASSANLIPMEYKALHTVGDGSATYAVTVDKPDTVTFEGAAKATQGQAYEFTMTNVDNYTVTYTVDGGVTDQTLTAEANNKYTIPAANIKGAITIKVTTSG